MSVSKIKLCNQNYCDPSKHSDKALCESKDQNMPICIKKCLPLKVKQDSIRSGELSVKKAPISSHFNKENIKQLDDNVLKMISYHTLEEKGMIIQHQKSEIAVLKQCVSDIKNSKQLRETEEERLKREEIGKLKILESDYTQNLKQFSGMKDHLKDIKKKYDNTLNDNATISLKNNHLLAQNEELNSLISNLKADLEATARTQSTFAMEEMTQLKQDLRISQIQREASEERSCNFEKRMNEYILKYNEMQGTYSQFQIKYYKMQKENDNLRVDKEEVEQKLTNLEKQIEAERRIHNEEGEKLKQKLKRQQEMIKGQNTLVQGLRKEMMCLSEQKNQQKEQYQLQIMKWQKYAEELLKQCNHQNQDQLSNLKQKYEAILNQKDQYTISLQSHIQLMDKSLYEGIQRQAALQQQIKKGQSFSFKYGQLVQQNQRISQRFIEIVREKDNKICQLQENVIEGQKRIDEKRVLQVEIIDKISLMERQIEEGQLCLKQQNQALHSENRALTSIISINQQKINHLSQDNKELALNISTQKEQFQSKIVALQMQNQNLQGEYQKITEEGNQKRYYREKYERQLEQYNQLSTQFRQIEAENTTLLKTNANYIIEIGNLKDEVLQLKANISKLLDEKQEAKSQALSEKDVLIAKIKAELEHQVQQIRVLSDNIILAETKYQNIVWQYKLEYTQWERQRKQWKQLYEVRQFQRLSLQNSKVTVAYELDSSQTAVEILKKENQELQRIFGVEIERRNVTIRELIREKKVLFEQLMEKGFS